MGTGALDSTRERLRLKREQLNDGQALATLETAGADDLAATFGGHPGTVTNLAGALFAVRAECGLHDVLEKRGSEVPCLIGAVKDGLSAVLQDRAGRT